MAINTETFTFTIDETGKVTGQTEIQDEPITLLIEKKNSYGDTPLGNVRFQLQDGEGNLLKLKDTGKGYWIAAEDGADSFQVDGSGKAEIRYLKAGEYAPLEEAPVGFIAAAFYPVSITEEHGQSNPYRAVIYNASSALRVYKVHAEDPMRRFPERALPLRQGIVAVQYIEVYKTGGRQICVGQGRPGRTAHGERSRGIAGAGLATGNRYLDGRKRCAGRVFPGSGTDAAADK